MSVEGAATTEETPFCAPRLGDESEALRRSLLEARRVAIVGEPRPDPDCAGSQIALGRLCRALKPELDVVLLNDAGAPRSLRWVTDHKKLRPPRKREKPFDVAICVDGGIERCGPQTRDAIKGCARLVLIDHHAAGSQADYALRLVDPRCAATTEIIFDLARRWGLALDRATAEAIFLGLLGDTGGFRYSSTRPETLRAAAALMEAGARAALMTERLLLDKPYGLLTLKARLIDKARRHLDGRVLAVSVSRKDFADLELGDAPYDRALGEFCFIEGVELTVMLKSGGGRVRPWRRLSFRSRGGIDCAALARGLDPEGGGHARAAGCRMEGLDAAIIEQILAAVAPLLEAAP